MSDIILCRSDRFAETCVQAAHPSVRSDLGTTRRQLATYHAWNDDHKCSPAVALHIWACLPEELHELRVVAF
mgnify:CR=1 FL=1